MFHCNFDLSANVYSLNIPLLDPNILGYEEFFKNFLIKNQPCRFSKDITAHWPAMRDWVNGDGTINFNFLRDTYGDGNKYYMTKFIHLGSVNVSVTSISDKMSMDYGGMDCKDMKVEDFLSYWEEYIGNGYPCKSPCLYLKDWHILKDKGNVSESPYTIPKYFSSDWMNETWEMDDFRFAYFGPKGSWTPFHHDVFGSFSWSANIIGQKRWRLYPPGKEKLFQKGNSQIVEYDFDNPGVENEDFIEVLQDAGEIIFVPSGWYHIVWNETDAISINQNWFNASNICYIWSKLSSALKEVEVEIKDMRGMDGFFEQCQLILKANHGMDYSMFIIMLQKIYQNRQIASDVEIESHQQSGDFDQKSCDLGIIDHVIKDHFPKDPNMSHLNADLRTFCST